MQSEGLSGRLIVALVIFAAALFLKSAWAADHETVLRNFGNGGGFSPTASLIMDAVGNVYGTTDAGGTDGTGVAFELSPRQDGGWIETVLYSFGDASTGSSHHSRLIMDAAGNLYGTAYLGGIYDAGTAFELSPSEDGGWTATGLYTFRDGSDGGFPYAGVIMDSAGNLYGTTTRGGIHDNCEDGCGTVFELAPSAGGGWTETVLHSFGRSNDGSLPFTGLTMDEAGNLYGTTLYGGIHGGGTVFELSPREDGGWTERVLHSFGNGNDGFEPFGELIRDAAGNLYGTTAEGGIHNCRQRYYLPCGTVFELSPRESGAWTERVLHSFNSNGSDGFNPLSDLVADGAGNLYGTTEKGGIHGYGTVFELSPRLDGGWTERVLHSFGKGNDGYNPYAGVIIDAADNLYGTTQGGGIYRKGTAFELSPEEDGRWTEKPLQP